MAEVQFGEFALLRIFARKRNGCSAIYFGQTVDLHGRDHQSSNDQAYPAQYQSAAQDRQRVLL